MNLTLQWKRVQPGHWYAGPYELLRGARGGWRILHNRVRVGAALTLVAAKRICEEQYAAHT